MPELLLVVTCDLEEPRYGLWRKAATSVEWNRFDINNGPPQCLSVEVGDEQHRVVVLCHPVKPGTGDIVRQQRKKTTEWLVLLLQHSILSVYDKVYIVVHRGREDWRELARVFSDRIVGKATFDHEQGDPVYDALVRLCETPTLEHCRAVIDSVPASENMKSAERLRRLKHDIGNLLRPFELALQGWSHLRFESSHWDRIAQTWSGDIFDSTLEQARRLLYEYGTSEDNVERVLVEAGVLQSQRTGNCAALWVELQQSLPKEAQNTGEPAGHRTALYHDANAFGQSVQAGEVEKVRTMLECSQSNAYKQWFIELIDSLEELERSVT